MIHPVRRDSKHRYWIPGPSGDIRVPGFSEIIKGLEIVQENPFHTEEGRARGEALHVWLKFLASGKTPSVSPDPRIAEKVEGIRKFLRDTGFRIVGAEQPRYDPESGAACTPDLWGFIGPWSWVLDMKSGAREPYHALQTACQRICLRANGFHAQKRGALYLKKNDYRLEEHVNPQDRLKWLWYVSKFKEVA